jgi:hypothetical protein
VPLVIPKSWFNKVPFVVDAKLCETVVFFSKITLPSPHPAEPTANAFCDEIATTPLTAQAKNSAVCFLIFPPLVKRVYLQMI